MAVRQVPKAEAPGLPRLKARRRDLREGEMAAEGGAGAHALRGTPPRPRFGDLLSHFWLAGDLAAGTLACALAFLLRYRIVPVLDPRLAGATPPARLYAGAFGLYLVLQVVMLGAAGAYRRPFAWVGPVDCRAVIQGVTCALMALLVATSLVGHADLLSRGWLLSAWVLACALIVGERLLVRLIVRRLAAMGVAGRRVLIVGTHAEALTMEWLLRRQRHLGLQVAGFVDDALPVGAAVQAGKTVLGCTADLRRLIRVHGVDVVLLSARASSHAQVLVAVEATLGTPAEATLSPDVFTVLSTGATVVPLPGMPVVTLGKVRLSWGERLAKEAFDRLAALALLVLLSPLLLILAVISRRDCGTVLERHPALGLGGTRFEALKFRTTRAGAGAAEDQVLAQRRQQGLPVRDDPALTRCGRVLRRSSLDELPQLWNVLRGQMSLVGPYKIAPQDLHHYGARWLSVVTLKPGITGLAQVHGRGELTIEERSILDAEYVRDYSLGRDVALLAATLPAVLRGRGAF